MITAAVGILGAGAVSAAEFEVAELYVPAVGLKQSAQWIDEEKFQAELTLEVSGLKELYKSQQENTASENGQLPMENSTWDGEVREAEAGLRHLREIKITINRRNAGFFMSNFIYFYVVRGCIFSLYVI